MAERRVTAATRRARQMMLGGMVAGHIVGFAVVGLAVLLDGRDALLSAIIGFAAVVLFSSIGQAVEVVACELEPAQGMALTLVSYAIRVVGITAGMWLALGHPAVAPHVRGEWLAAGVVATTLAWTTGVVLVASRQRVPVYDR